MLNAESLGMVYSNCVSRLVPSYMQGMQRYILYTALKHMPEELSVLNHKNPKKRRRSMKKVKLLENILKAATALIDSGMSIIKFINILNKM